jgi:hypothetical protein
VIPHLLRDNALGRAIPHPLISNHPSPDFFALHWFFFLLSTIFFSIFGPTSETVNKSCLFFSIHSVSVVDRAVTRTPSFVCHTNLPTSRSVFAMATLPPTCAVCPKTTSLSTCSGCNVIQYCSRPHQVEHRPIHKGICKRIGKAKLVLKAEEEEEKMLNAVAGKAFPAWAQSGTTLDPLLKLATAELEIDTRLAVQAGLNHVLEMAGLSKTNMLGTADLAVPCFLRLGRDQECYDFMKWWITTPESTMQPPKKPYTSVRNADVLESSSIFMGKCPSLNFMACLILLKLRILMDLQSLQRSAAEVGGKLPQELVDEIRADMVSSALTRAVIEREDHSASIAALVTEIKEMLSATHKANEHFWPGVLHSTDEEMTRAENYGDAVGQEMLEGLRLTYKAWAETPGAREAIEVLLGEK